MDKARSRESAERGSLVDRREIVLRHGGDILIESAQAEDYSNRRPDD